MNHLDDLLAALDERADHADAVRPDLGAVRTRARRKRRTHQAVTATVTATAAVTAVGLGVGALFSTRSTGHQIETGSSGEAGPTATTILLQVPLTAVRALPDGATLTADVTAPLPTYGPYGDDHLWYPPAACPVDVLVKLHEATDLPTGGGSTGLQLPIAAGDGERRASWYWSYGAAEPALSDVTSMVMVPGTVPGEHYRLKRGDDVLDETTADGPLTLLAGQIGAIGTRELVSLQLAVERTGDDGEVLATLPVDLAQADAVPECEAVNQPVDLGPSSPPVDEATADAAVRAAAKTVASASVGLDAGQSITPLQVHWTSPTSAWVKYQIVYFPASEETGGKDQGPLMWAEITFDGSAWTPTAEARCNYARSWGTGDTCPALPQIQAAG